MSKTFTGSAKRPSPLSSNSFARYEPPASPVRSRATTVASPVSVQSPKKEQGKDDVFEKSPEVDEEPLSPSMSKSSTLPDNFDELPIELASLTDRFVESLSAKVYNEPPTIDQLADLFQEFYARASASIAVHISALKSRIHRDTSPTAKSRLLSSKKSADSLAPPERGGGSQKMLTATEVTEKRKARRMLELKRVLLEEAVERRACEKIYEKIWRHKSTLDEVRDEKLRSKTAALALVGIGLKDLGIEMDDTTESTAEDLQESLAPAREGLAKMNEEHYPLGKLQHLTTAHKAIVDCLSTIKPSSSSADEILPTLIYTLVTSPIEGINIISNLNFIQRFRSTSKVDGEAAYCLTNLEAAISFLENVDLASLRADERPEGPEKSGETGTPIEERPEPFPKLTPTTSLKRLPTTMDTSAATETSETPAEMSNRPFIAIAGPSMPRHQRTLSDLLQPISSAPGAVRSSAEESLKTISSTLDNSFKVLFGKLRERSNDDANAEIIVPKTLDEARQLVSRPLTPNEIDDSNISETSSIAGDSIHTPSAKLTATEEKVLGLFGGRRHTASSIRDRSADSRQSNESTGNNAGINKKVAFAATGSSTELLSNASGQQKPLPTPSSASNNINPLDSVKSFGQSINMNPLNNISSAFGGAFRSFGRQTGVGSPKSEKPNPLASPRKGSSSAADTQPPHPKALLPVSTSATSLPSTPSAGAAEEVTLRAPTEVETAQIRAEPAQKRFMDCEDAADLKISEVLELLRDYQRLGRLLDGLRVVGEEEEQTRQQHQTSSSKDDVGAGAGASKMED